MLYAPLPYSTQIYVWLPLYSYSVLYITTNFHTPPPLTPRNHWRGVSHSTIHILLPELPWHYMSPGSPAARRLPPCPCLKSEIESHLTKVFIFQPQISAQKFQPQISAQDRLHFSSDAWYFELIFLLPPLIKICFLFLDKHLNENVLKFFFIIPLVKYISFT